MSRMRYLVSEWEYRDPKDPLHDIDGGNFLAALQELPQSLRQLLEDGDMHVELRENNGRYRPVKIVKKRDPEFQQSTERHFYIDPTGRKVPITEEELDALIGIQHNKEDLYEQEDIELVPIDSEAIPPMDAWDIVYDATNFITQAQKAIRAYQKAGIPLSSETLFDLYNQPPSKGGAYSADWFPYREDKRIRTPRAKHIARLIATKDLSKRDLAVLMGKKEDYRREVLVKMKKLARTTQTVKSRRKYLIQAQKLRTQIKDKPFKDNSISASEKRALWRLWRDKQIQDKGAVKLTSWQYEAMLQKKYLSKVASEEMTHKEAQRKISQLMKEKFPATRRNNSWQYFIKPEKPAWLKTAEELVENSETIEEEYEFAPTDWLESQIPYSPVSEEEEL